MKFFNIATAVLGLALTFSASAHISLKQSTPESNVMLMQSPKQLTLTFSGEVRLAKVLVSDSENQRVDFSFKPSATPNKNFNWSLPNLSEGSYTVKWIALGGDGHKMSGTFNFMLHGKDLPSQLTEKNSGVESKHEH